MDPTIICNKIPETKKKLNIKLTSFLIAHFKLN